MLLPVRQEAQSANILLSTTPDGCIRRWAIKHPKLSISRKEHHPLINCRFFCLDKGEHLTPSPSNNAPDWPGTNPLIPPSNTPFPPLPLPLTPPSPTHPPPFFHWK